MDSSHFHLVFVDSAFVLSLVAFAATYWLHSTLLLGSAWFLTRAAKPKSHFVCERIWKMAAVAGFLTAAIQLATGLGVSLPASSDSMADSAVTSAIRSINEGVSPELPQPKLTGDEAEQQLDTSLRMVQNSLKKLGDGLPESLAESKVDFEQIHTEAASETLQAIDPATLTSVTFLPLDVESPGEIQSTSPRPEFVASPLKWTAPPVETAQTAAPGLESRWSEQVAGGLVLAWFLVSLLYLAWQSLRFRWQIRHVSQAAPAHCKLLESIRASLGVRRQVRLLKSDCFEEPVAYGLTRWTILIPAHVEKRLNRDELAALLAHELAHLMRGDIAWLVIGRVLTTCFAYQPMNFLARRHWQEHAEFQCDDRAVGGNVDRLTLARSLTLVAEWRVGRKSCAGVVSAGWAHSHVTDRVERLVADAVPDLWRRGFRHFAIHMAALLLAGAVIVFGPQTGIAERPESGEEVAAETLADDSAADPPMDTEAGDVLTESDSRLASSNEELGELIREINAFTDDISRLLEELPAMEPVLAQLEQQPELADRVGQLRTRIGLLRKLADAGPRGRAAVTKVDPE